MAKEIMTPEDRELRNIALALGAGLLGFPVLTLDPTKNKKRPFYLYENYFSRA